MALAPPVSRGPAKTEVLKTNRWHPQNPSTQVLTAKSAGIQAALHNRQGVDASKAELHY
jgi:hypothetical protein